MSVQPRIIGRYFLLEIFSVSAMGIALFWSAGRLDWWPAWVAIVMMMILMTAQGLVTLFLHPDLFVERLFPPPGAKTWDRTILSLIRLMELGRYILAGLDARHGWTSGFPMYVQVIGIFMGFLGYGFLLWALSSNKFFSQVVRLQSDRNQSVVTSGPYRCVRHPAYAGVILFELSMAVMLASWVAIIASGICALLLILRTALEDRTLQAELDGYKDYARQVRYRLIPRVW